jgi:fucose permease
MIGIAVLIFLSFLFLGAPNSLIGTVWPAAYPELGVPFPWAGWLSFALQGAMVTASFFSGRLSRRMSTGVSIGSCLFLMALSLLGISAGGSYWLYLLFCVPLGLGMGFLDVSMNSFAALHLPVWCMSWLHGFWSFGAMAGPYVMAFFLGNGNWRGGYAAIGRATLLFAALIFLSLPQWKKAGFANIRPEDSAATSMTVREILHLRGIAEASGTLVLYNAVEGTAFLWGSSYLVLARGVTEAAAARWISLFFLGIALGRISCGFLAMKLPGQTIVRLGEGAAALGILCLLIPAGEGILPAGFLLTGMGCGPIYPTTLRSTPDIFGKEAAKAVMGVQIAIAYVGSALLPPIFGWFGEHISMALLPYFLLLFLAGTVAVSERLSRIRKKAGA